MVEKLNESTFKVLLIQDTELVNSSNYLKGNVFSKRTPVVLRGVQLGDAVGKWNAPYLSEIVGKDLVKVHVSPSPKMNFLTKNFQYKTLEFNEFIQRATKDVQENFFVSPEEKYYLRSLGTDPRKDIADVTRQYPKLADDLKIPEIFDKDKFYSSVFRISSSGIQLWTHYDIMDNILIHIVGRKRVVLFPPDEAENLYMIGDKSQIMEIDDPNFDMFPKFRHVKRYECMLEPGDVLFIPALWFHNVTSLDYAVSVNVFWKHLDNSFYDTKDVYGNKDLMPAQRAMQGVDKALKTLEALPATYRKFYGKMLISRIYSKIQDTEENYDDT